MNVLGGILSVMMQCRWGTSRNWSFSFFSAVLFTVYLASSIRAAKQLIKRCLITRDGSFIPEAPWMEAREMLESKGEEEDRRQKSARCGASSNP